MQTWTVRQTIELFHLVILDHIGRKLDKRLYALKGGCNLRFYCQSIRYSEDMDLDVQTIAKATLENKIDKILQSQDLQRVLATQSISIEAISKPKQTQTTQRWKMALLTPTSKLPLHTKLEFSRRKMPKDSQFEAINSQIMRQYPIHPIMVNHYSPQAAFIQKVEALISRTETQARDVFDLYHLLQQQTEPGKLPSASKRNITKAIDNAMSVSFADFKAQVVAFLETDYQSQYGQQTIWDTMLLTVVNALEGI